MEWRTDSRGNSYVEESSVRLTVVKNRPDGRDWAGESVVRIQARRGASLHMGAEVPLSEMRSLLLVLEEASAST